MRSPRRGEGSSRRPHSRGAKVGSGLVRPPWVSAAAARHVVDAGPGPRFAIAGDVNEDAGHREHSSVVHARSAKALTMARTPLDFGIEG